MTLAREELSSMLHSDNPEQVAEACGIVRDLHKTAASILKAEAGRRDTPAALIERGREWAEDAAIVAYMFQPAYPDAAELGLSEYLGETEAARLQRSHTQKWDHDDEIRFVQRIGEHAPHRLNRWEKLRRVEGYIRALANNSRRWDAHVSLARIFAAAERRRKHLQADVDKMEKEFKRNGAA